MITPEEIEARESLIRDLLTQSAGSGTKRRKGLVHQTGRCDDYLLWVPILGGQMVKIKLSRFDEREFPRGFFEYTDDETTFPVFNGLFHYENATRQMAEQRTITQPGIDGYPAGFYSHIGTYQFNFPCRTELSNNAKDGSLRAQGTVSPELLQGARELILKETDIQNDNLPRTPIAALLWRIAKFTDNNLERPQDSQDSENSMNFEDLMNYYSNFRQFIGNCRTYSTLVTGFCESLGIPARILMGEVFVWETFKHNGHMWPEVYIPSARRWAVLEPYNTEASPFLHYPSLKGDMAFILEGAVYPRTGGELKIDISFSKQTAGYLT